MFLDYYNLEPLFLAIHSALCSVMPEGLAIFLEGLVVGVVILLLYAVLAIILIHADRSVQRHAGQPGNGQGRPRRLQGS